MRLPRTTLARTLAAEAREVARREARAAARELQTPSPRKPRGTEGRKP